MMRDWIILLVFGFVCFLLFGVLVTLRPLILQPLNATLSTMALNNTNTIYQDNSATIFNSYDFATWFFLLAPFVYIIIRIIKREPQPEAVGQQSSGDWGGY
jgi:hypothetical protein